MERKTVQRQAILKAFELARRPLGPQEVLAVAQAAVPGLGIATVYRHLKALVASGQLAPVQISGEPPRYELVGKGHHHHFRCRTCEQVYDVTGCPGNLEPLVPKGFRLERHEVVLHGQCLTCRQPARRPGKRKS
jgi:Fur family ferric uptake transcriptional regulator